jgi:hypothetical protein
MLSDEIRARLARLHRSHPVALAALPGPAIPGSPSLWSTVHAPDTVAGDLLARGVECANGSGVHLRMRRPLAELWPQSDVAAARVARAADAQSGGHPELVALAQALPAGSLFLDLETCGFAGSMVFLVGLVWQDEGRLMLDQLIARDYAEERALLETLWQIAGRNAVLVSYNGKSFDWPMVHDRSTRYHLGRDNRPRATRARQPAIRRGQSLAADGEARPMDRETPRPLLVHCDLLHHARRHWKRYLPNCKLQTLEQYICRRRREDDLPGALVPAAYHDYVRSGQTGQLGGILKHNALDLVTLVELACRLAIADGAGVENRPARSA